MRVRQKVMREQNRLRRLQVGLARHDRGRVRGGLGGQRGHQVERGVADVADGVAQPHAEQRGHLVVSRPARPQPAAELVADPVDQPALQSAVDVLVGGQWEEAAVGDVLAEAVQTRQQPVALLLGQQARPVQHSSMGLGRRHVVRRKHPVEVSGLAQCRKGFRRSVGEPAAPQRALVGGAHRLTSRARHRLPRSRCAAIFEDSPWTWTKPFALDWSKVSPSS